MLVLLCFLKTLKEILQRNIITHRGLLITWGQFWILDFWTVSGCRLSEEAIFALHLSGTVTLYWTHKLSHPRFNFF